MYKNHINVKQFPPDGETFTEPSQTIKGESYTIKELLQKHVRGMLPPNIDASPQFSPDPEDFDQPDLNQMSQMDITDKHIVKQNNISIQKDLMQEIQEAEQEKADQLQRRAQSIAQSDGSGTEQPKAAETEDPPKAD